MQEWTVGEVVEWIAKGLAILALLTTLFVLFVLKSNDRFAHADTWIYVTVIVVGVVSAIVFFLIGRALRYILISGK